MLRGAAGIQPVDCMLQISVGVLHIGESMLTWRVWGLPRSWVQYRAAQARVDCGFPLREEYRTVGLLYSSLELGVLKSRLHTLRSSQHGHN